VMHRPLRQRPGSADSRAEDGGLVAIAQCRLRPDTRQGIGASSHRWMESKVGKSERRSRNVKTAQFVRQGPSERWNFRLMTRRFNRPRAIRFASTKDQAFESTSLQRRVRATTRA
jgi:hypothetical protein